MTTPDDSIGAKGEPSSALTAEQFYSEWSIRHGGIEAKMDDWPFRFAEAYAAHATETLCKSDWENSAERSELIASNAALRAERDQLKRDLAHTDHQWKRACEAAGQAERERDQLKRQFYEFTPEDVREMAYNANALLQRERDRLRELLREALTFGGFANTDMVVTQSWYSRASAAIAQGGEAK